MPRKENSKGSVKVKPASAVLKFIASLIFLYVLYVGLSSGWGALIKYSVWVSVVFAVAVLSIVALFFGSLGAMAMPNKCKISTNKVVTVSALTTLILSALSWNMAWIVLVVIGFLVGWLGDAV